MPVLQIALFGGVQTIVEGQFVTLAYDKVRALLAYLLIEAPDHPQRRETLVGLLWPEQTEKEARHSLSQALLKLRQAIDPHNDLLVANRQTVGLHPAAQFELDTAVFTTHLQQCQTHPHAQPNLCESCMALRETAVSLYKGPFLAGLSLPDAPQFEQWLTQQREHYHRQVMDALTTLTTYHEQRGAFAEAIHYAQRQLTFEPWREETHRLLMMLFARTGQRSLALKQYEQCRASLQQELNADVSPETDTLSNQIKLRPNFSLHNLPVALTPFIGREAELATLTSWLQESTIRLITITGIGGMGKTRLALATAERFLHPTTSQPVAPFADGIYFIDLVPLATPDQLETAVADVLNLQLMSGNGRSPRQQLIDYLSNKQMLLIFDNFEHLLAGTPLLNDLLQAVPKLTIIATSRTQLRLRGEKVLSLSGLAHHPFESEQTTDSFNHDAAQMFLATATQIEPALNPSQDDLVQINEICRMVAGTPLAVELAARWVDTLPLATIARELSRDITKLETDLQDLPPRQRSMHAVFQSSWQRLPESAKRVLARASLFQGGFTLDAAITILGATHQTLALLVNHSLLRFDRVEKRYNAHELLRQFAAAQLATNPDLETETRRKHLAYYCQLAAQGEQHLRGGDTIRWKTRLIQEKGNWQVAFNWGVDNHLQQTAQMVIHLSLFWFSTGQMQLGEKLCKKLLSRQDELPEAIRGWVLTWYTAMIWVQGRLQETRQLALEAYHLFLRLEDNEGIIMSYHHQFVAAFYQGDFEAAFDYNDHALEIARGDTTVDQWFLRFCLQSKSSCLADIGQDEAAYRAAAESYQLCQDSHDLFTQTYAMSSLARLAIKRGEVAQAKALCQQALALAQDINDQRMEAIQYNLLGQIALAEKDFPAAVNQLETAVTIGEMINNTDLLDESTKQLGEAYLGTGQYALAFQTLQRWAQICQQLNNEANMVACLEKLAAIHWQLNPGNRQSARWLAAVAAWHNTTNKIAEDLPANQLLKTMQNQLSEAEFTQSWEEGLSLPLHSAIAEAINADTHNLATSK